ncbi:LytR family transcriptional regulator [Candidatus Microgenomates bacterium]|nr:MAG: LytR family transcriptional regulator [Candidatus Microgenomates bacterium]
MQKKIFFVAIAIFLIIFGKIFLDVIKFSPVIFQLLFKHDIALKQVNQNINILLLGVGGGTHEGFDLTDTIIFASLDQSRNKVTLVSIPRDLWVPDLNAKINAAYHQGEVKKKGGGLVLSKAVAGNILNQPIDYAVKIDFDGFVKVVDAIGGVEIMVDNTFDDNEYPISGKENENCGLSDLEIASLSAQVATGSANVSQSFPCRYKHLHFEAGKNYMDGKTALEFVRSRHAIGEEGTDFARSKRQGKVIKAVKDKVLSVQTFLNPQKILSLYGTLKESIETDIKSDEYDDFIRLGEKMRNANIQSSVLDYGNEEKKIPGLLINPIMDEKYQNQWVLIPRIGDNDFSEIKSYIDCEITKGSCTIPAKW